MDANILLNLSNEPRVSRRSPLIKDASNGINNVAPESQRRAIAGRGGDRRREGGSDRRGSVPGSLEGAYVNDHGVIPHHHFPVDEFEPATGKKASASARSWISPSGPCAPRQPTTSILAPRRMALGGRAFSRLGRRLRQRSQIQGCPSFVLPNGAQQDAIVEVLAVVVVRPVALRACGAVVVACAVECA